MSEWVDVKRFARVFTEDAWVVLALEMHVMNRISVSACAERGCWIGCMVSVDLESGIVCPPLDSKDTCEWEKRKGVTLGFEEWC